MAYGDETEGKKEERFATERATRERRAQERAIKKQRRQALNQATSTKERREIKKEAEEAILKINGPSSAGGNQKGGIYDISTDNYSQPERNQTNQDSSIEEAGIDTLGGSSDSDVVGDSGGSGGLHALQLVAESPNLYVRQGTIGSIIPTIGGTALEADYTENDLSTPNTGTRQYWLNVTVASGAVTAVSIVTAEPGADSATQAKLLLGSVETNSNSIIAFNSNLSGSQSFASCGSTHFFGVV
jgi:hypothetical protein